MWVPKPRDLMEPRWSIRSMTHTKKWYLQRLTLLPILDNGIVGCPRLVLSRASAKAESVLGTICDWSLGLEILAHYFGELMLAFDLSFCIPDSPTCLWPWWEEGLWAHFWAVFWWNGDSVHWGLYVRKTSRPCFRRELGKTLLGVEKSCLWAFKIK